MSKISIKGAETGTGVFTLASPATNTDRTLTLPDEAGTVLTTAGVPASAMPAGSVLQVVSGTVAGNAYSFSSGYNNVFGPSLSITPSSLSNKILIIATGTLSSYSTSIEAHVDILFNGTRLSGGGSGDGLVGYRAAGIDVPYTIVFLHAPATTSAVTYTVSGNYVSGSAALYNGTRASDLSRITLMEIAA